MWYEINVYSIVKGKKNFQMFYNVYIEQLLINIFSLR